MSPVYIHVVSDQQKYIEFELVQRAQQGDAKAFEELVILSDHQVLNLAYSMTGSLTDAQDIYQETFLRAFKGIGDFRFQSSFRTWVLRIAVNQAINWRKKKKLKLFFSLDAQNPGENDTPFLQITDDSDASAAIRSGEILQQIHAAMHTLSSKERAVFSLRHFQEIKIKEIARMLECAEGTVKNLLFRATQKMQKALAHYIEE
ncbi:RNA polymerase sigma factor [candidate division KSB1 bacterium]|nr:RNA polymerase sigma factor [candidate division KSB1 bacterium]